MTEAPTVFYSWQSDSPTELNRWFIRDALKVAIDQLGIKGEQALRLDHDIEDEPGTADIPYVIFEKISSSAIMVADVSLVGETSEGKGLPNPNVMVELGYGAHSLGWERIILVMNASFGAPEGLPFDLRHRRFPLCYTLTLAEESKAYVKKRLSEELCGAISNRLSRDHAQAGRIVRRLDRKVMAFLRAASAKKAPYFADDADRFPYEISRLLEAGIIFTDHDPKLRAYTYHWTYVGALARDLCGACIS
ncbi:hypothetical protein ACXR0O_25735 [Verrucomicrobiota bacterium sgz303538]